MLLNRKQVIDNGKVYYCGDHYYACWHHFTWMFLLKEGTWSMRELVLKLNVVLALYCVSKEHAGNGHNFPHLLLTSDNPCKSRINLVCALSLLGHMPPSDSCVSADTGGTVFFNPNLTNIHFFCLSYFGPSVSVAWGPGWISKMLWWGHPERLKKDYSVIENPREADSDGPSFPSRSQNHILPPRTWFLQCTQFLDLSLSDKGLP